MAYTKTTWVNGGAPAINSANLNKIEQGILDGQDITESSSNSAGSWIKYADGTMIVRQKANNTMSAGIGIFGVNTPVNFINNDFDVQVIAFGINNAANNALINILCNGRALTASTYTVYSKNIADTTYNQTVNYRMILIGRWK